MISKSSSPPSRCRRTQLVVAAFLFFVGYSNALVESGMAGATSPPWKDSATAGRVTPPSTVDSFDEIMSTIKKEHATEIENGISVFGDGKSVERKSISAWSDADFRGFTVGKGNAGPDEKVLTNGEQVFQTVAPVLTDEECDALIAEAKKIIAEGLQSERGEKKEGQEQRTNSQLGEARASQLPLAREWLKEVLHSRFFPLLESRFGIPAEDLTLQDSLVIGYGYFGGGSGSQPVHRDSSLLSLNVALSRSSDYQGGGTFFEGLPPSQSTVANERGHVVCHAGGTPHAGTGIQGGERWVLVLFVVAKNQPELARRCHAKGIRERAEGLLDQAKATFEAGLQQAPKDHLLLTSLGGIYIAKGDETTAQGFLSRAAFSYSHCTKANMALGRMLLAKRRSRGALRRFDAVLDWMQDRDLEPGVWGPLRGVGWDARVYGAQAAFISAREAKMKGVKDFPWREHVERAVERSNIALQAVPGDPRLLSMLEMANQLLSD